MVLSTVDLTRRLNNNRTNPSNQTQAYLDYLVGTHAAPPPLHDELFLLLLTALLAEGPSTPSSAAVSCMVVGA